ncbi:hypothetical protein Tco_0664443 [Tanacetum coccineum]
MRPYGSALLSTQTWKFSPNRSIHGIRAYSTRYEGVVPKVVSLGDQVVYLGVVSKAGGVVAKMLEWCPRVLLLEKG